MWLHVCTHHLLINMQLLANVLCVGIFECSSDFQSSTMNNPNVLVIKVCSKASTTSLLLKVSDATEHLNASRFNKVQVKALGEAIPAANAVVRVILYSANWMEEAKVVEEIDMVDFLNIPRRVQSQCCTIGWRF